ncbi:MAG: hypothetical protein F4X42_05355, partial [Rhodospirillaceae bacterium]|nr:hypothetical protein [Rhodospirillaceae bacterium]
MRIAIVAPSNRIDQSLVEWVKAIAAAQFGNRPFAQRPELVFHPQCFLSSGHFAGTDRERAAAFLEVANDPAVDAVWFARGGYGASRLLPHIEGALGPPALEKTYLGYSDAGNILALLMKAGVPDLAHGPMPTDIRRDGGEAALRRALAWLVDLDPETVEPSAAERPPRAARTHSSGRPPRRDPAQPPPAPR